MTDSLVAFLLARLDAEHEIAEREQQSWGGSHWADVAATADSMLVGIFSPARVLADIAAKRAIIDLHQHVPSSSSILVKPGEEPFGCAICAFNDGVWPAGWCPTVRALASVYADHPDYDQW